MEDITLLNGSTDTSCSRLSVMSVLGFKTRVNPSLTSFLFYFRLRCNFFLKLIQISWSIIMYTKMYWNCHRLTQNMILEPASSRTSVTPVARPQDMTSLSVVILTARQPIVLMHFTTQSVLDDVYVVDVTDVKRVFLCILNTPSITEELAWAAEIQINPYVLVFIKQ